MLVEFREFLNDLDGDAGVDDVMLTLALIEASLPTVEMAHCPKGYTEQHPLIINGKPYIGGEFISDNILRKAIAKKHGAQALAKKGYEIAAKFGQDVKKDIDVQVAQKAILAAARGAGFLEHKVLDLIKTNFARLPLAVRAPVLGFLGTAFSSYIAGQKTALAIAKQRGDEKYVHNVARMIVAADMIGAKAGPAAAVATGLGAAGAGLAYMMPIGSASYIIFSSAKDPAATLRAARQAVASVLDMRSKAKERMLGKRGKLEPPQEAGGQLGGQGGQPAGQAGAEGLQNSGGVGGDIGRVGAQD